VHHAVMSKLRAADESLQVYSSAYQVRPLPAPDTLHPTPYILHSTPYTLHPLRPCTLSPRNRVLSSRVLPRSRYLYRSDPKP